MTERDPKVLALAAHLKCKPESINESRFGTNLYESEDEPGEYLVLTDREADDAFKESTEQFVEECVLPEIPENYRDYFDVERFTRDVLLGDGRGHSLASYDGAENEEQIDGDWYYIYRVS